MGKVLLDMAISLDGFVAGPNDEGWSLHDWFFTPGDEAMVEESINSLGAIIMGRRSYDLGDQQDGFVQTPYKIPHLVVTHRVPEQPAKGSTQFIFVMDGIESALRQAQTAAGDKAVAIGGGANLAQQYLKAGLVDEIQLHVAPILVGKGLRLFDEAATGVIQLERTRVVANTGVTHLKYTVVR